MKYLVYPGHGVGRVLGTEKRQVLGTTSEFIRLCIIDSGMIILIPKKSMDSLGVRKIMSKELAERLVTILQGPNESSTVSWNTWNKVCREYIGKIKSGSPEALCDVILALRGKDTELSFGERKVLSAALDMLTREIQIALGDAA